MVSVSADSRTVYEADALARPALPTLRGDVSCDVCVVGGGFTGLSAAWHLASGGRSVVLLERGRVGDGASGRNGGHASLGQRLRMESLERMVGEHDARALWAAAVAAMEHLKALIADGLDCGFRPGVLRLEHRPEAVVAAHRYAEMMARRYGHHMLEPVDATRVQELVATQAYAGGVLDRASGHLDPLRLALGLAERALAAGAALYEASAVLAVDDEVNGIVAHTREGLVRAKHVVYAGNGLMTGLDGAVDAHVMPIRNYILATEPLGAARAASLIADRVAVSDSRFIVYYFRVDGSDRLIFGGGETYSYRDPPDIAGFVRRHMLRIFPQLAEVGIEQAWGGTLGITRSRMPYVRRVGRRGVAAVGYSGRGVVLAPYLGKAMADELLGRPSDFELFARLPMTAFPGGPSLRAPLLTAGMLFYKLRDMVGS